MPRRDSRMLWVTPGPVLPCDDGNRQRLLHLILASAQAHHVTLLTPPLTAEGRAELRADGVEVIEVPIASEGARGRVAALRRGRPSCLVPGSVSALERAARDVIGSYDLAFGPLAAAPAVMAAPARRHGLDDQNHEAARYRSILTHESNPKRRLPRWLDVVEVSRYERRWLAAADLVTVCSEDDRRALAPSAGAAPITVIPNGVDTVAVTRRAADTATAAVPPRYVFVGGMSYEPNIDAAQVLAQQVMPEVWARSPEAELWLVGKEPSAEIRALAGPRIIVTGRVSDPVEHLHGATATIVALRSGGGTRLKILEAMAAGVPVVATPTAVAGLELTDGVEAMISSDPQTLARHALAIAADPRLADRLSEAARQRVVRDYDWAAVGRRFAAVL